MEGSRTSGPSDYAVRALVVVLGAAAVHGVFASILLRLLTGPGELPGQALSVALSVLLTALAELAFLYVRTQYASPDHVARTLPWVCWATPPIASVALALVAVPVPDGSLSTALLQAVGPVFAACVSVGLMVGMLVDRLLRILAAAYPRTAAEPALLAPAPPTLAYSYVRVVFVSGLASTVVALAAASLPGSSHIPAEEGWLWALALLLLLGWAPPAAMTLGMSPGSDIRSLARRLDTYEYDAAGATGRPVVVTRGDEVGALLANLEALRIKLRTELDTYDTYDTPRTPTPASRTSSARSATSSARRSTPSVGSPSCCSKATTADSTRRKPRTSGSFATAAGSCSN